MGNKEYLNVNELATLFGLNVQTLHYYDKIGILKPSYRDPKNGYRKYRFDQTYNLASIRYMRKLGYSIDAVRDFQDTKSPDEALKRLKERSADIHAQWEEMMRIDHAILRKIQFIEDSKDGIDYENFQLVKYPERKYIPIGEEDEIYTGESFYFYPTIVFYGEKARNLVHFSRMISQRKMRRSAQFRQELMWLDITREHTSRFRTALKESRDGERI